MNQSKKQKYLNQTKEEIKEYLANLKILIKKGRYKISDKNREDNINFIHKYRITTRKQKEMLLELDAMDFCYSVDDYNCDDKLYIFSKDYELDNWSIKEKVPVYIKTNIIQIKEGEYAIIISFHERKKEIKFLFK